MVVQPTGMGFLAYSPGLSGCVSTRTIREEAEGNF
jgi:hypothetical protein